MASTSAAPPMAPVPLDTPIAVKVNFGGVSRKFKIPLRDLGANVLPAKLRSLLQLSPDEHVVFERYSDSQGAYVLLRADAPAVYKTLFRAAKAKLKLRLRATVVGEEVNPIPPPPAPVVSTSPMPLLSPPLSEKQAPAPDLPSPVSPMTQNKVEAEDEAHMPKPFTAHQSLFNDTPGQGLAMRPKVQPTGACSWVVYCNNCQLPMRNEHYHCSICDSGDYDLCPSCVDGGLHCPGSGHWMVKRFVRNGLVVNSTTERLGPKKLETDMPGAFTAEKLPIQAEPIAHEPDRTCNCCVKVLPEKDFVTCIACEDYDLCIHCHITNKHGHHPGHGFKPAVPDTVLPAIADFLCNAGRNVRHSAVCDGCDKFIYGVRHKCLNCPDWDFCSECMKNSKFIHPRHRFVPVYEPLAEPIHSAARHVGIFCDGPLCKDKDGQAYIEGVRYKCAVCHDTDFCANCEALPANSHNHTHPLIKFKTPVRNVSVTTVNEGKTGSPITQLGDRPVPLPVVNKPISSADLSSSVSNIECQTVTSGMQPKAKGMEIRDLLSEPVQEKSSVNSLLCSSPAPADATKLPSLPIKLDAHFIRDTVADGTWISANHAFVQVWTLRNPGPNAWPIGCSVRHVGGDNMLNLDNTRALGQSELCEASESNAITHPVEPGEEMSFRVILKAPTREGTAISYWRLKTAEGMPFGHRLWCDIQVVQSTLPTLSLVSERSASPEKAVVRELDETAGHGPHNLSPHARWQQQQPHARASGESLNGNSSFLQYRLAQLEDARLQAKERTSKIQEDALRRLGNMMDQRHERHDDANTTRDEKAARPSQGVEAASSKQSENSSVQFEQSEDVPEKIEAAELPVGQISAETQANTENSSMIFPTLDKESPASSLHEALEGESKHSETKPESISTAVQLKQSDEEFFEDAESVEIRSLDSDDDGFMTDEYDVLTASDEEDF